MIKTLQSPSTQPNTRCLAVLRLEQPGGGFLFGVDMGRKRKQPVVIDGVEHWRCTGCGEPKPSPMFSKGHGSNGLRSRCKECTRPVAAAAAKKYYHNNIAEVREKDRARRRVERSARKESAQRLYRRNKVDILSKQAVRRAENRDKIKAVDYLNCAVKRGDVVRPSRCEVCGEPNGVLHGHHDSYERERWLVVTFMCRPCHTWTHARRTDQANGIW